MGFCMPPKYPIFNLNLQSTNYNNKPTTCQNLITEYLLVIKELFSAYTFWGAIQCLLHISLVLLQLFKLPAETAYSDTARADRERKLWLEELINKAEENFISLVK